ncbi:MAG TPA: ABC transporter ATP-binding protein, partial [Acidimicrobiia bacterium]|nr:ABC transporter ATP-binding protein [Acidimicrobiia bacterium]
MSTTKTEMPPPAPKKEPMPQQRLGSGPGRFGALGMPAEKTADFRGSLKRLLAMLRRERFGFGAVVFLALASVSLSVIGPKILGRATDVIFTGLTHGGPSAINFPSLHRVLWFVVALYAGAAVLGYVQSYVLAGIVQRTMCRLRESVEAKLNRLPLRYVDGQARGDLLSRVTNDIDNLAQGMQQTLSQLLTSTLMLVGTLVLMFVVSWLLALVALVTIPLSLYTMKAITKRSRSKFVAQWRHTGALNALVEESFTGHHIVKAFGRQGEVEARFRATNEALYDASFGASFISG